MKEILSSLLLLVVCHANVLANNDLPSEEYVSSNGKLDVTLEVAMGTSLNGARTSPLYNGRPVGPTLRVKPGDTLTVNLVNRQEPGTATDRELYEYTTNPRDARDDDVNVTIITNRLSSIGNVYDPQFGYWGLTYTNLHFHGAEFPPSEEDVMVAYDGGKNHTYTLHLNNPSKTGTTWYHTHFHGTATYGMLSGLYGLMIIEGEGDVATAVPELQGAKEQLLLLAESLTDLSGETNVAAPSFPIVMAFDWLHVTNGEIGLNKTFEYKEGDLVLFRSVSASVEPTMVLTLENHTFTVVARDGFTLESPQKVEELVIGAGQRVDFVVKFSKPGSFIWHRAPWDAGGITGIEMCLAVFQINASNCVSYDVPQIVAVVNVVANDQNVEKSMNASSAIPLTLPATPVYLQDLASRPATNERTVVFQMVDKFPFFQIPYEGPFVPPGVAMGMDDRFYTPFYSHGNVTAGSCETWTIKSIPSTTEHVFHTHSVPFLVTHENGAALETPFWTDTHFIPTGLDNFTAHICFDGLKDGDRMMVHCHMPTHQDIGVS